MSASPNFALNDLIALAAIPAAANTNHDGSGALVTLFTGVNAQLHRVDAVQIAAAAAAAVTTAGKIRFFLSTDGGATKRKIGELNVTAATPSATVAAFIDTWYPPKPINFDSNQVILYCCTHNAEAFHASVFGSRFS